MPWVHQRPRVGTQNRKQKAQVEGSTAESPQWRPPGTSHRDVYQKAQMQSHPSLRGRPGHLTGPDPCSGGIRPGIRGEGFRFQPGGLGGSRSWAAVKSIKSVTTVSPCHAPLLVPNRNMKISPTSQYFRRLVLLLPRTQSARVPVDAPIRLNAPKKDG